MYLIKTNDEGRIVSAMYKGQKDSDGIYIEKYPGSPLDDYVYIDGKVMHSPRSDRPKYDPVAPTQMDIIEAQVSYTAMMTDTVLEVQ